MPWSGSSPSQTFSRTDGTRTGSQTWQEADAAGVDIVSSDHDTHDQDMASGINSCLKKDGGNAATDNLPMGGFRHTNVGSATARTNYARFSDLQDGKGIYVPTVGGTANAITLTTGYSVTAYAAGQTFRFKAAATNSGAATVNVDSLGAKSITGPAGTALSGGQILVNALVTITYDGTQFQLTTEAPAAVPVGTVMAWTTATIPAGWLECDGSAVSRSSYAALFAVLGSTYGSGDGSTTFNVPDYRGYFLRGHDGGEGNDPDAASRTDRGDGTTGDNVGTKQADEVKGHTHGAGSYQADTSGEHNHSFTHEDRNVSSGSSGGSRVEFIDDTAYSETDNTTTNGNHTHTISGTSGSTGGDETRPKNIYVKWIILADAAAALPVAGVGKVETWIGARSMTSRAANGAATGTVDSGDQDVTLPVFDFDASADEFVQFEWAPPKKWNVGTVSFIPYWTNASGLTTETVCFTLAGVAISNDDPLNATLGTAQSSTDTWIAQGDLHIGPESSAITIGGTPAEADLIVFQLGRDVSEDNLTGDARLIGVKLIWTANATSDD